MKTREAELGIMSARTARTSKNAFFENAFFENAFFGNAFFENAFFEKPRREGEGGDRRAGADPPRAAARLRRASTGARAVSSLDSYVFFN